MKPELKAWLIIDKSMCMWSNTSNQYGITFSFDRVAGYTLFYLWISQFENKLIDNRSICLTRPTHNEAKNVLKDNKYHTIETVRK